MGQPGCRCGPDSILMMRSGNGLCISPGDAGKAAKSNQQGAGMARERILVVEDEEEIQELIAYNLNKEGFRTVAALSGEDALKKARSEKVDLVLLDLMLPGMDGLDVCRALKKGEKTQAIPVVMLTAKGEESDIVSGLELGADDYIVKPFSPKILVARIKTVLRRKRAE